MTNSRRRPGITDARAWYRAEARQLRYTELVQGRIHGRDFVSMFYKIILRFRKEYFVIKNGKILL